MTSSTHSDETGLALLAYLLLLVPFSFKVPSPRLHILSITSSLSFLGNPTSAVMRLTPAQLPERTELVPTFLNSVLRRCRRVLCTGFLGGEPWSHDDCQAPLLYLLVKPDTPRRLVFDNDASNEPLLSLAMTTCSRG
jgi:hypothetical protein